MERNAGPVTRIRDKEMSKVGLIINEGDELDLRLITRSEKYSFQLFIDLLDV